MKPIATPPGQQTQDKLDLEEPIKPTQRGRPEQIQEENRRKEELQRNIALARKLFSDETVFDARVVGVNSGGFICDTDIGLKQGFVALRQMDGNRIEDIMLKWTQLGQSDINNKRKALLSYLDKTIKVKVNQIYDDGRIYLSEKTASKQQRTWSAEALEVLKECIGREVDAVVVGTHQFGVMVRFSIEEKNNEFSGVGMIHQSEISWDTNQASTSDFKLDQQVRAIIVQVDTVKKHVSLSIRQMLDNPVMQSLDLMKQRLAKVDSLKEEDLVDIPAVENIKMSLSRKAGIINVETKLRVLSRASAQELQVFLSKEEEEVKGGLHGYSLLVRLGLDVQEISITSSLEREEFKDVLSLVVEEIKNNE
eukprot:TRINITY_DN36072_c0_g1_i4.p1 TRINITY_DN36072_c0_g1~~TRINITY_DN36072_c0_g1_i4.p1  ORF type:complete len:365 (-),score=60.77 TRINITY_DN36072_c0_g1_i4:163-1257(-)